MIHALLALRQHQLNNAVGIKRVTPQVALLLQCHQNEQQRIQKQTADGIARNAFYLGVIRGAKQRLSEIKALTTPDTPLETAQALYKEALTLHQTIKDAEAKIG